MALHRPRLERRTGPRKSLWAASRSDTGLRIRVAGSSVAKPERQNLSQKHVSEPKRLPSRPTKTRARFPKRRRLKGTRNPRPGQRCHFDRLFSFEVRALKRRSPTLAATPPTGLRQRGRSPSNFNFRLQRRRLPASPRCLQSQGNRLLSKRTQSSLSLLPLRKAQCPHLKRWGQRRKCGGVNSTEQQTRILHLPTRL